MIQEIDQNELIKKLTQEVMNELKKLIDTSNPIVMNDSYYDGLRNILNGGASRVSSTIGIVNVPADIA
ncbi:MAG: hypothetical protein DRI86_15375, partial [Bacteroidetes bacterium]